MRWITIYCSATETATNIYPVMAGNGEQWDVWVSEVLFIFSCGVNSRVITHNFNVVNSDDRQANMQCKCFMKRVNIQFSATFTFIAFA